MPRDGAGNFSLVSGNPVVTNTIISSTTQNSTMSDVASGLTQSLSRDGQTTPTADLTMGNFKLRNVASALARTDAPNAGQIQDGALLTLSSISGTDTITASTAPAITTYTAGQIFYLLAVGANTTNAVTLNLNTLGAKSVLKQGPSGLVQLSPGDIFSGSSVLLRYDGTQFVVMSTLAAQTTAGMVNNIINGGFDVWQRGTSFSNATTAANSYTADMWQCLRSTFTGNYTVTRQAAGIAGSRYALRLQRTAGDTSVAPIQAATSFETSDVIKWQGAQKTVAIQVLGNGAFNGATATLSATFGTGTDGNMAAGFTGSFGTVSQTIVLTGSYQQVSLSFSVPGTATQMGISIAITPSSTAAGASDYFQIAQAQQNNGGSALQYEQREYALDFSLCERHYKVVQFGLIQAYQAAGNSFGQTIGFSTMRASPTASFAGTPAYSNASGAAVSTVSTNVVFLSATATALGACTVNTNGGIILNASQ